MTKPPEYNRHQQFLNAHSEIRSVNPSQLSVLSYANYFTLWHYKTDHSSILTPHYFDVVADILRENDMIIATTSMGETPQSGFYTVLAKAGGHIVVTDLPIGRLAETGDEDAPCDGLSHISHSLIPQVNDRGKAHLH